MTVFDYFNLEMAESIKCDSCTINVQMSYGKIKHTPASFIKNVVLLYKHSTIKIQNNLPVALIGTGPVGMAAISQLSKRNIPFILFESGPSMGSSILLLRPTEVHRLHIIFFTNNVIKQSQKHSAFSNGRIIFQSKLFCFVFQLHQQTIGTFCNNQYAI